MSAITHRALALSAAALFTCLTSAAAQQVQPVQGEPPRDPVVQSPVVVSEDDDAGARAESDFRVLNLPSTLGLPLHAGNFQLTHRFNGNLRRGTLGSNAGALFGLDQGAAVGFEYRFGIAPHVEAAVYRTAIDRTLQLHGKYDAVRQHGAVPVSLSALVSVEGADNFRERYAPALGLVVSRTVSDRLAFYATPVWVHNTAALLNADRDTAFVGIGGKARLTSTLYVVGEVAPRVSGYRPDTSAWGFGVETRVGGHVFQLNLDNGQGTTLGQIARGGFPHSLYLGFNLARKFF